MVKKFKDVPEVHSDMTYNWSASSNTTMYNDKKVEWLEPLADITIRKDNIDAITIETGVKWYTRIWYILTNPITYIFTGYMRY